MPLLLQDQDDIVKTAKIATNLGILDIVAYQGKGMSSIILAYPVEVLCGGLHIEVYRSWIFWMRV
jgi:hypothetical protein